MEFILRSALFLGFGVSNAERGHDVEEQPPPARYEPGLDRNYIFRAAWFGLRPYLLAACLSGTGGLRDPSLGILPARDQLTWEFL